VSRKTVAQAVQRVSVECDFVLADSPLGVAAGLRVTAASWLAALLGCCLAAAAGDDGTAAAAA
jgi:hypothetical protein